MDSHVSHFPHYWFFFFPKTGYPLIDNLFHKTLNNYDLFLHLFLHHSEKIPDPPVEFVPLIISLKTFNPKTFSSEYLINWLLFLIYCFLFCCWFYYFIMPLFPTSNEFALIPFFSFQRNAFQLLNAYACLSYDNPHFVLW